MHEGPAAWQAPHGVEASPDGETLVGARDSVIRKRVQGQEQALWIAATVGRCSMVTNPGAVGPA